MSRLVARFDVRFPEFRLDVDLDLPLGGVTVVFGPSGCGKTTLLRAIAGLERAAGRLRVGDAVWQDAAAFVPPHRRAVGFVFQDARLFAHRSVKANLLYGYRRTPPPERQVHPDRVVELLGLESLLERRPDTLSAGERQRVGIGRALLTNPRLLLMDEPLANLDQARKREILPFILRLRRELSIPIVYVSHSLEEVLQLVDTLVLLEGGRVRACGPAPAVLTAMRPEEQAPPALAGTLLETVVQAHEPEFGLTRLLFHGQTLHVPRQALPPGSPLRLHLLARDVSLVLGPPGVRTSVLNILEGVVREIETPRADDYSVQILLDVGEPLLATITRKSLAHLDLKPGQKVYAHVKALRMLHDWE